MDSQEHVDMVSSLPSDSPSMPPSGLPPARGRPRSTSISNGSPSPISGATIPLPSLIAASPTGPTPVPWTFGAPSSLAHINGSANTGGSGWGHRVSLSVPGIVSPVPVGPGSVARGGRHRRTQSVSPPGFPVLSEGDASGFASGSPSEKGSAPISMGPPRSGGPAPSVSSWGRDAARSASPSHSPSDGHALRLNHPLTSKINIARAEQSPTRSSPIALSPRHNNAYSPSTSPTAGNFFQHNHSGPHRGHAASHAALLTGIRSHALPQSPTLSATGFEDGHELTNEHRRSSSRSPAPHSPQSSPPFGPTSSFDLHKPSPLSLELRQDTAQEDFQAVLRQNASSSHGQEIDGSPIRSASPFERNGAVSPPLLPLPCSVASSLPAIVGRSRAGSIGRDRADVSSPSSLASQYLETEVPAPTGHVEPRRSPEDHSMQRHHRPGSSPPMHSLASGGLALFPPRSPQMSATPSLSSAHDPFMNAQALEYAPISAATSVNGTPRSPLATADADYDPAAPATSSSPPVAPTGQPDACFPDSSFPSPDGSSASSPCSSPAALAATLDLLPPPSPHRGTISLPPPLVAPAPLPPHLGGPQLHHHPPARHKPSHRTASPPGAPGDHAPKRHSPLASPAISRLQQEDVADDDKESDESQDEVQAAQESQVAAALLEAETTEMDLGSVMHAEAAAAAESTAAVQLAEEHGIALATVAPPSHPRSGWDMDESSEDELDEVDMGPGDFDGGDLALTRMTRAPSPPTTVAPSCLTLSLSAQEGQPELQSPLYDAEPPVQPPDAYQHSQTSSLFDSTGPSSAATSFGTMDVDAMTQDTNNSLFGTQHEDQSELSLTHGGGISGDEHDVIAIDEDSLSALEKIFVCAKSDHVDERARVARLLPEWLAGVDICEATEYVLPLLTGLATDHEDMVKEMFAPQLDRVMWHFFSQCPLFELEASPTDNASPVGSPVPSRYVALRRDSADPSPASTHFISDDSGSTSTPPTTSKTTPTNTEVDVPRISATTFTSLLGALLTDQSSSVAKATEAALVRFLCMLKGKPPPAESPMSSPMVANLDDTLKLSATEVSAHHHHSYQLGPEATRVLEDEFITGIVLGLARLEEEDREHGKEMHDAEDSESQAWQGTSPPDKEPVSTAASETTTIYSSPQEESIEDGWSSGPMVGQDAIDTSGWGEPLSSFFDDGLDHLASSSLDLELNQPPQPAGQLSFAHDDSMDEEAAIGKLVSMSLIGAIAAAECLESEMLVEQILPEVERMKDEQTFYVRKEAAQALGSLAKLLPVDVLERVVLPLHTAFANDTLWHVRRAACLVLPAICKQLPPIQQRKQAVEHIKAFNGDSSLHVRSGALEVCGELTYMFHGNVDGVPDEILAIFLGQADHRTPKATPAAPPTAPDDELFTPLQSALDSPPDVFLDNTEEWRPSSASARDPDRSVMCAFNLPAVALTLGGDRWEVLRSYHHDLCQDVVPKVRQSLASSLHEIAKIIGPDQSDACLLEPFSWYLRDYDHIQGAMLENLPSLLRAFGTETSRQALNLISEAWAEIKTWRRREAIAGQLGEVGVAYIIDAGAEPLLNLMQRAFKDPVAAVREEAVKAIPALFNATSGNQSARNKLWAFLSVFGEDTSYRNRMVFVSSAGALVRAGMSRDDFEAYLIEPLARLARDRVINVQITVARLIGEVCRIASLYEDSHHRAPLYDILACLAHCSDRDVRSHVAEYYTAHSPLSSPQAPDSRRIIPMAARTNPHAHGISSDDEDDVRMVDSGSRAGEGEGEDVNMLDPWDDEYIFLSDDTARTT